MAKSLELVGHRCVSVFDGEAVFDDSGREAIVTIGEDSPILRPRRILETQHNDVIPGYSFGEHGLG